MAHFRGTVRGDKSNSVEVSRLGHKRLSVRANGWDAGVEVELYINADKRDCARIGLTGGSNGSGILHMLYDGPIDRDDRNALTGRFDVMGKSVGEPDMLMAIDAIAAALAE